MICMGRRRCVWRAISSQLRGQEEMNRGWSIDRSDWKGLEEALKGKKNWSSVLLTPNEQVMVPTRPGVYAICAPPPNATGQDRSTVFHSLASPLYIGKSESNIQSRFMAHCRSDDPQLQRAKRCYRSVQLKFWFVELDVGEIRKAEAWLIRCFSPPVNRRAEIRTISLDQ